MLAESVARIDQLVDDGAVVLDIGGGYSPFPRADWVMDILPFEERAASDTPERFSAQTWITRDICDREPYPFEDGSVDFVVCSHTLEDVRDPLWVCSEMNRIARAGYVEVPSRLEEQTYGVHGPWVGWAHHRWLVEELDGTLEFALKPHVIHRRKTDHFPGAFLAGLTDEERVLSFFWSGGFGFCERIFLGPEEVDRYLADFVARELAARGGRGALARRRFPAALRAWSRRPEWLSRR